MIRNMNTDWWMLNNMFITRHRWLALVNEKMIENGYWHPTTPEARRDITTALFDNLDAESEMLNRFQ